MGDADLDLSDDDRESGRTYPCTVSTSATPSQAPVIIGMQIAMQALFAGLVCFVIARTLITPSRWTAWILVLCCLLCLSYVAVLLTHALRDSRQRLTLRSAGLGVLAGLTLALVWMTTDAAYLLFPLSFLFLEYLPHRAGLVSVCAFSVAETILIGVRHGWTVGGVLGPMASALVAIIVGLTTAAWRQQASRAEGLYRDLLAVQGQLAQSERQAGILAERARLTREIHDTVAQGLSSITLLLNAVERADPASPAMDEIRLARETASTSLAETRSFIREFTPPLLADQTLAAALRRLAATQWRTPGLAIEIMADDSPALPMPLQTALLRVAQGAMANVVTHAHATHARIKIVREQDAVTLSVCDDGVGMDPEAPACSLEHSTARGSFGLRAIGERVEQLGGSTVIDSSPLRGTRLSVRLPVDAP